MAKARPKPKTFHYHACAECGSRYPDGCENPGVNDTCNTCRYTGPITGRISVHAVGCQPRDCCRVNSRQCNKDDLKVYRLRGSTNWWICKTCARTFSANPRSTA